MLKSIVTETQKIFSQRDMIHLAKQTVWSLRALFGVNIGIVGIKAEDGVYYTFDFNGRFSMIATDETGHLLAELGDFFVYHGNPLDIRQEYVNMWIGEEKDFVGFVNFVRPEDMRENKGERYEDCPADEALELIYETLRIAFINTKLNNDLIKGQEDTILSFATVCEGRSGNARNHIKRVSEYVRTMARNLGYSREEADDFALSAMMHDIGKMSIPEEIIDKPDKLTDEEYNMMKSHVLAAEDYIVDSNSQIIENARRIAREHHERWDGTGYLGLKEDEINELAAVTAIADVFDVLVSRRSYKESWTVEEAYNEIVTQDGKQFSPKAIQAFKESYNDIVEILAVYKD